MRRIVIFWMSFFLVFHVDANDLTDHLFEEKYPYPEKEMLSFASCSKGPVKFVPMSQGNGEFVVISNGLNESCFANVRRRMAEQLYLKDAERAVSAQLNPDDYDFGFQFAEATSSLSQLTYEVSTLVSPFQINCFEACRYLEEQIIRNFNTYYFLHSPSDYGVDATMINKDVLLFKAENATSTGNISFHIPSDQIQSLPGGDLEFLADGIIVRGGKYYFEEGGAFWYDSKITYTGEVVELYDVSSGTCFNVDKFDLYFRRVLQSVGRDQLCVER